MKRTIIRIDEQACTGCGLCVPNCPEGAIRMIDGKARLIGDMFCDGLGACLGHCPEGAIHIEEREAEAYDETKAMANIAPLGPNVIRAHLEHLKNHGADKWFREAIAYLRQNGIPNPMERAAEPERDGRAHAGCPGARAMQLRASGPPPAGGTDSTASPVASELENWPLQLHLASPSAPYFKGADILLAADCTAFAMGDFHSRLLKGKRLIIGCPKLDSEQEIYEDKLTALIDEAGINTLTVAIMLVPCCGGLLAVARRAAERAQRRVPIRRVVVGLDGVVEKDEWLVTT